MQLLLSTNGSALCVLWQLIKGARASSTDGILSARRKKVWVLMKEFNDLRGWVSALLSQTEAGPDFDVAAITREIESRYGPIPPDPIPDFWDIADRHRGGSLPNGAVEHQI